MEFEGETRMQIELPPKTVELANSLTTSDKDAAAVISEALERMALEREEVAAVMEGVAAYERGDYEPWEDFSKRFKEENGITAER